MKIDFEPGMSSAVTSRQRTIHPGLDAAIKKHLQSRWQQPLHAASTAAFEQAAQLAGEEQLQRPLILDSGCGTGESTRAIASHESRSLVFGIDRSIHRLRKTGHAIFPARENNIIWVRAELTTFWRLAVGSAWELSRHYLLYPNPYPKPSQLGRRWHAHPVFPVLLALGGELELRCNWSIYALEFARAIEYVTGVAVPVKPFKAVHPLSSFERKYSASDLQLFQLKVPAAVQKQKSLLLTRTCQEQFHGLG
jgi:tRNA G46 methylase TrmB